MFYTKDARSFLYVYKTVTEETARRLLSEGAVGTLEEIDTVDEAIALLKLGHAIEYQKDMTLHYTGGVA